MYLISYDLSNNRLRKKVADELENYGKRVQYSVFECDITEKQLLILYNKLAQIMIDEEQGSVRIYVICANCKRKIQTIGVEKTEDQYELYGLSEEEEKLFII